MKDTNTQILNLYIIDIEKNRTVVKEQNYINIVIIIYLQREK